MEQSILWRVFGWYRIKMTIAGIGVEQNDNQKLVTCIALPVGNRQEALMVLRLACPPWMRRRRGAAGLPPTVSLKRQQPQVSGDDCDAFAARWMDLLTSGSVTEVTTVGYTAGSARATTTH